MADSAGARIAFGLGIAALIVVLAVILEQARGGSAAAPEQPASTAPPSDLQFCVAWRELAAASKLDRSADAGTGIDIRGSLERIREIGFPITMSLEARSGFLAAVDEVESSVDATFAPTAYPADPAEDQAFSTYLTEHCPA